MKNKNQFYGMRDFLILWGSQAVSSLGSSMTSFALIIWVYQQKGTAASISLLSFFTYLPSILFCFIAGTIADRWDKKKIMLISDLIAAMGTLAIFILYNTGSLAIIHLYIVNFLISFMNAFQSPASYVATSLLVPKDKYDKASGLQAFSSSLVSILTPSAATAVLALGGLNAVFIIDFITFITAFSILLLCIKIPKIAQSEEAKAVSEKKISFIKSCSDGLRFLKQHSSLLRIILFFSFVNLLAYMTGFGIMPAMILSRTQNNEAILGLVSSSLGLGTLAGSVLVTLMKPSKKRTKIVFFSCAVSFIIANPILATNITPLIWIIGAFVGNLPLPFLNANITVIMRSNVPIELQGRVFSTRDTIQYSTIPLGLFLGGYLADNIFEPFMQSQSSPLSQFFSIFTGTGKGSGIAVMFLLTGIIGCIACLIQLADKRYDDLNI